MEKLPPHQIKLVFNLLKDEDNRKENPNKAHFITNYLSKFNIDMDSVQNMKREYVGRLILDIVTYEANNNYPRVKQTIILTVIAAIKCVQSQMDKNGFIEINNEEQTYIDIELYKQLTYLKNEGTELLKQICTRGFNSWGETTTTATNLIYHLRQLSTVPKVIVTAINNYTKYVEIFTKMVKQTVTPDTITYPLRNDRNNLLVYLDNDYPIIAYNFSLYSLLYEKVSGNLMLLSQTYDLTGYINEFARMTGYSLKDYAKTFHCTIVYSPLLCSYVENVCNQDIGYSFDLKKHLLANTNINPIKICGNCLSTHTICIEYSFKLINCTQSSFW